ncbi:MAG TPA: molybdopterin molybdenumtransferase MoeA, partial [Nocardioides sp.]|nr:molybdopterin molybdenumtransferase MoeA [Nocardioides sp.]
AIRRMMGKLPYVRPTARARLTHGITSPAGKVQLVRGLHATDGGGTFVSPVGGHGSHLIGDLATASCLIEVAADVTSVRAGEMVAIRKLDEEF